MTVILAVFIIIDWRLRSTSSTLCSSSSSFNTTLGTDNALAEQHAITNIECPPHRTLRIDATTRDLPNFINATLHALDFASKEVTHDDRPIVHLATNYDKYATIPGGFWTEFGVFQGSTLLMATNELLSKSKTFNNGPIAGFDSFEGLPEKWRKDFGEGTFGLNDDQYTTLRKKLPDEVKLYKGWFQETIPAFKAEHDGVPAALIHHDGDLFLSTTITLQLLNDRILPGTHMIFDELVGYPEYEKHEIFALWMWMTEHEATVCAMGHMGPIGPTEEAWVSPREDQHWFKQSAWLQVLDLKR
mmetsp:Transcript_43274/g.73810  ORF Transcript_43274/g.73810 Transcript_43274/m.73810 type:complete len:301 (-) Transcript_43274:57-959(-)